MAFTTSGTCQTTTLFNSTNSTQELGYTYGDTGSARGAFATFSIVQIIPPPTSGTDNYPAQYTVYIDTIFKTQGYNSNGVAVGSVPKLMLLSLDPVGPPPPYGDPAIVYTATIIAQNSGSTNSGLTIPSANDVRVSVYTAATGQVNAQIDTDFVNPPPPPV